MDKVSRLQNLKSKKYKLHGIFDFKRMKLLYVSLSKDATELEYGLENYDEDRCDMISFDIKLN